MIRWGFGEWGRVALMFGLKVVEVSIVPLAMILPNSHFD